MKLKLNPSNRANKRYLLIEAKSKEDVERVILDYIGILGWAKAGAKFLDTNNGKIILSIDRGEIDNIRAAFELAAKEVKVEKVSGTLKSLI